MTEIPFSVPLCSDHQVTVIAPKSTIQTYRAWRRKGPLKGQAYKILLKKEFLYKSLTLWHFLAFWPTTDF